VIFQEQFANRAATKQIAIENKKTKEVAVRPIKKQRSVYNQLEEKWYFRISIRV